MTEWASGHRDPTIAAVVNDMITSFVMQRSCPDLAQQLDDMRRECNPARREEKNANLIAEQIEKKKIPVVAQINYGNGTQIFPEQPNIKTLNPNLENV